MKTTFGDFRLMPPENQASVGTLRVFVIVENTRSCRLDDLV